MNLKLGDLTFTNRLKLSCPHLFIRVKSTPLTDPVLLHVNFELMDRLHLDRSEAEKKSFLNFINGDLDFEGLIFGSTFYSGHQFGHYVPRLGDGRAMMLAEVETPDGDYYELQLKGSGLTPFSRMGDGKAVVRSSIREYLASAHMKALSVPTTEALAIIHGSDHVYREELEKSAIVLRVSESFLRFGHFQYYHHTNQLDELKKLLDFTIATYFKEFADHPNRAVLFYQEVVKRTAKLFARWQSIGFCHGVLNTDNMSVLGLTIDYGPYGFLEKFDFEHICNHSDHEGRYSFGQQPPVGMWNLEQLGIALSSFINEEDRKRTLETYPRIFNIEYRQLMMRKCGLQKSGEGDEDFLKHLLSMLIETEIDYTQFMRALAHYQTKKTLPFVMSEELSTFLAHYEKRLQEEESDPLERQAMMLSVNPKFILRNYLAQQAIENYLTNPQLLSDLFKVLTHPFDEWSEFEEWSLPAPLKYKHLCVSCSS